MPPFTAGFAVAYPGAPGPVYMASPMGGPAPALPRQPMSPTASTPGQGSRERRPRGGQQSGAFPQQQQGGARRSPPLRQRSDGSAEEERGGGRGAGANVGAGSGSPPADRQRLQPQQHQTPQQQTPLAKPDRGSGSGGLEEAACYSARSAEAALSPTAVVGGGPAEGSSVTPTPGGSAGEISVQSTQRGSLGERARRRGGCWARCCNCGCITASFAPGQGAAGPGGSGERGALVWESPVPYPAVPASPLPRRPGLASCCGRVQESCRDEPSLDAPPVPCLRPAADGAPMSPAVGRTSPRLALSMPQASPRGGGGGAGGGEGQGGRRSMEMLQRRASMEGDSRLRAPPDSPGAWPPAARGGVQLKGRAERGCLR